MCGIAGVYDPKSRIHPDVLDAMIDVQRHRGPDDRGVLVDGEVGLGMRRLSIIDIEGGAQPVFNEDGTVAVVYNGEIYNFPELRSTLEERGHRFSTNSDTETIVHLYEEFGDDCAEHLRGMFAFALWDARSRRLLIARDRFGIKPLFFSWDGTRLAFASELKSLMVVPWVKGELDATAVDQYFALLYVPRQRTLFAGVRKLLPGHTMVIECGRLAVRRYYDLPAIEATEPATEEEWVDRFFEVAEDTVRGHLLSDVPLGAFLSGGVDSSLVVALMSQLTDRPVDTFSIGYEGPGDAFDERGYARQVADLLSTNHRELVVTPAMASSSLPGILDRLDEPFGNASVIPNFLLAEFARNHVKVALSGLGGDEVCGGYERYLGVELAERFGLARRVVGSDLVRRLVSLVPDSRRGAHFPERLKRFVEAVGLSRQDRYYSLVLKFHDDERSRLFRPEFRDVVGTSTSRRVFDEYWNAGDRFPGLRQLLYVDMGTYLTDDLLALSDRTSMAHSLEMRVPLVDNEMVRFFWSVPDSMKLRGLRKKYLLKRAAERVLPKRLIYRKKTGFSVPLTVWFRGELREYVRDMLSPSSEVIREFFDGEFVGSIVEEHLSGRRNYDERIYALISFVVWYRQCIQRAPVAAMPGPPE